MGGEASCGTPYTRPEISNWKQSSSDSPINVNEQQTCVSNGKKPCSKAMYRSFISLLWNPGKGKTIQKIGQWLREERRNYMRVFMVMKLFIVSWWLVYKWLHLSKLIEFYTAMSELYCMQLRNNSISEWNVGWCVIYIINEWHNLTEVVVGGKELI